MARRRSISAPKRRPASSLAWDPSGTRQQGAAQLERAAAGGAGLRDLSRGRRRSLSADRSALRNRGMAPPVVGYGAGYDVSSGGSRSRSRSRQEQEEISKLLSAGRSVADRRRQQLRQAPAMSGGRSWVPPVLVRL